MWKWMAGIGAALVALLQIVTRQRDKAREAAKQAKHQAETTAAIREAEQRIAVALNKQREARERVQNELDDSKGQRPTGDFGDTRLRMRDNKD